MQEWKEKHDRLRTMGELVLIVGEPGVGKTTLFNKVFRPLRLPSEKQSLYELIDVDEYKLRRKKWLQEQIASLNELLSDHKPDAAQPKRENLSSYLKPKMEPHLDELELQWEDVEPNLSMLNSIQELDDAAADPAGFLRKIARSTRVVSILRKRIEPLLTKEKLKFSDVAQELMKLQDLDSVEQIAKDPTSFLRSRKEQQEQFIPQQRKRLRKFEEELKDENAIVEWAKAEEKRRLQSIPEEKEKGMYVRCGSLRTSAAAAAKREESESSKEEGDKWLDFIDKWKSAGFFVRVIVVQTKTNLNHVRERVVPEEELKKTTCKDYS
jgi:ATPase subunit of ABC transporter with duplicated ATPase domains